MPCLILDEAHIHPAIRSKIAEHEQAIVKEVIQTIRDNDIVVVGMGMNPFPKKERARRWTTPDWLTVTWNTAIT